MSEEYLERHYLCKVTVEELTVWRVLCLACRNRIASFKRMSFSELDCDECGAKFQMPRGNLFVKDKLVVTTARYPDIENARNDADEDK